VLGEFVARLVPGGYLVIGLNEVLPDERAGLRPVPQCSYVFRT
jgi:chemotaxis methyl-accepting protein methylase